ncbi:hypothetical protein AXG93_910s1010 [Marchantia polymorpha subsp. ruderalis]|uniref:Uncharacterized protein n=1 Tax=Marchantia polymorpha subsp. ruderalis TaxID=1480154 RepID=A0A176WAZ6_MARPO|nr:hypothetical protein AXG93_910s1010 [Marchantia polymorpha subsp. ruderalis]
MRLRQGKATSSLDYAFGGRLLRPSAFGASAFDVRFRLWRKQCAFGDAQDVEEKPDGARSFAATLLAEAERTKESAEDMSSPRAPSPIRERRTASAENGGIKIERTCLKVRATAEREFERANWAVTPSRRHRIQASRG